jgi:hypothetical protein
MPGTKLTAEGLWIGQHFPVSKWMLAAGRANRQAIATGRDFFQHLYFCCRNLSLVCTVRSIKILYDGEILFTT